jgi:hypothetical protein
MEASFAYDERARVARIDFSMGVEALLRRRRDANSPSYVTATA